MERKKYMLIIVPLENPEQQGEKELLIAHPHDSAGGRPRPFCRSVVGSPLCAFLSPAEVMRLCSRVSCFYKSCFLLFVTRLIPECLSYLKRDNMFKTRK